MEHKVSVGMRDNKTDGAALVRIARELRETLTADCEGCRRRVKRSAIEGCDPPSYVHEYPTIAPCTCDVDASVFDDIDRVEAIGLWLWSTSPIVLPANFPSGEGVGFANVIGPAGPANAFAPGTTFILPATASAGPA